MAGKKWSEDDLDYVKENYGSVPVAEMARRLHRTVPAVRVQAQKMHLGRPRPPDVLSMYEMMEVLGMEGHAVVKRWIDLGWLKATRHSVYGRTKRPEWWIREADIIAFIKEHPEQLTSAKKVQPPYRQYVMADPWMTLVEAFRRGAAWPFFLENAAKSGLIPEIRKRGAGNAMWVIPERILPDLIEARRRMTTDVQHRRLVNLYNQVQAKGKVSRRKSWLNKKAREMADLPRPEELAS